MRRLWKSFSPSSHLQAAGSPSSPSGLKSPGCASSVIQLQESENVELSPALISWVRYLFRHHFDHLRGCFFCFFSFFFFFVCMFSNAQMLFFLDLNTVLCLRVLVGLRLTVALWCLVCRSVIIWLVIDSETLSLWGTAAGEILYNVVKTKTLLVSFCLFSCLLGTYALLYGIFFFFWFWTLQSSCMVLERLVASVFRMSQWKYSICTNVLRLLRSHTLIYWNEIESFYLFWGRVLVGPTVPRPRLNVNKVILGTGLCSRFILVASESWFLLTQMEELGKSKSCFWVFWVIHFVWTAHGMNQVWTYQQWEELMELSEPYPPISWLISLRKHQAFRSLLRTCWVHHKLKKKVPALQVVQTSYWLICCLSGLCPDNISWLIWWT